MAETHSVFFNTIDFDNTTKLLKDALKDADAGELYFEYGDSEVMTLEDGIVRKSSSNIYKGFGLRKAIGCQTAYAHACDINEVNLKRALEVVQPLSSHPREVYINLETTPTKKKGRESFYISRNSVEEIDYQKKIALLENINVYARQRDSRVVQVIANLEIHWQLIAILDQEGRLWEDKRPLVSLNVFLVVRQDNQQEVGRYGGGGRIFLADLFEPGLYQSYVDKALKQALVKLEAKPAPAGVFPVVLGPGWSGIILHEAVGHGLEGDGNRKKLSAFYDKLGQQVGSRGLTVVDDGTIAHRRGSLTFDDEGTFTQENVLIEDGVLVKYMQDKINARLMGVSPTGNGRRESYKCPPMPRMTNTFMRPGPYHPEEIIRSVERGIYAVHFGGGEVDITSGKFVFSAEEAYMIEKGKITYPIKGATLIGDGPEVIKHISMIGNDLELDPGVGMCGKLGQLVPVGVGQPTVLVTHLTVGGISV